jgi:hypothetical protein
MHEITIEPDENYTKHIPPAVSKFETLSEAHVYLETLLYAGKKAVTVPDARLNMLFERFAAWSTALDNLTQRTSTTTTPGPLDKQCIALLKMHRIQCSLAKDIFTQDRVSDMYWDTKHAEFQQIIDYATEASACGSTGTSTSTSTSAAHSKEDSSQASAHFSLDLGIIGVLLSVVTRCRDPALRRRAIRVLQASRRQEGVWDSALTALVAEKWVRIEEHGLPDVTSCADVPEEARLASVRVHLGREPKTAVIEFAYAPGAQRNCVMDRLTWA